MKLELLAPAANPEVAIAAINHGADAVYIGGPSFGARKNASNSLEDIHRVVEYAHPFGVKVYATLNTIMLEHELKEAEKLAWDLYRIGVDALIVQDMAMLRLDLPPLALHVSTQCDTRTPEKAKFLQDVGFSQIVLARELTLEEIQKIREAVSVPLECFVHGALCVSYSGVCHASQATCGRSANRGECAQICRLPYDLLDSDGKVLAKDAHLLSLKDFNMLQNMEALIDAGVTSFKIEGRLKDAAYVKNITAAYSRELDRIIALSGGKYERASKGICKIQFDPNPEKSFNRGFTTYFFNSRQPSGISNTLTPKSMGERIKSLKEVHNGDGLSFINSRGDYEGFKVNRIENGRIISRNPIKLPDNVVLRRTFDQEWENTLSKAHGKRRMWLDVRMTSTALFGIAEGGIEAIVPLNADVQEARKESDIRGNFDKFGATTYYLRNFSVDIPGNVFIPNSQLADARRRLLASLSSASRATYGYELRLSEDLNARYPDVSLDFHANVANSLAEQFYTEHGAEVKEKALESHQKAKGERSVMTTRHCILRERGLCMKNKPGALKGHLPLYLKNQRETFRLEFDCKKCEMHLYHKA